MKELINKILAPLGIKICARCGKPFLYRYSGGSYECNTCIRIIMRELIAEQLATKYNDGADPDLLHNRNWMDSATQWMSEGELEELAKQVH